MNAFFYPRLALSGMRRDRRIYAPYLAACVFMTAVVYDLAFLADSPALYAVGSGVNGMGTSAIRLVMTLGKWVMAVFALLFFFYTNAFLIRRRKKELGLMSVLGMDRGALTSLLFWETAFSALVSLTAGLALGVLLTQLSARVLSHFARTELPALPLLDLGAVRFCVLTDAFIFFLLLLNAWRQVRRASAVSLLRSDSLGERPPRSQWLLVLPGLGLLGGAYYLAVTITEPITAMLVFFVAVVMVILATFLLFIAGSVTLCRTLQGNDRFYYQKKNFVALSSLVYRMKRSGAGLAVICILSTMILVMLGSTAGLYFGAEDVVRTLSAEMSREIAAEARAEFYATYGSLFFLALVLSTVFLLASVLMLYYKQLSEGYEDARPLRRHAARRHDKARHPHKRQRPAAHGVPPAAACRLRPSRLCPADDLAHSAALRTSEPSARARRHGVRLRRVHRALLRRLPPDLQRLLPHRGRRGLRPRRRKI